jgi:hypothetical protein
MKLPKWRVWEGKEKFADFKTREEMLNGATEAYRRGTLKGIEKGGHPIIGSKKHPHYADDIFIEIKRRAKLLGPPKLKISDFSCARSNRCNSKIPEARSDHKSSS